MVIKMRTKYESITLRGGAEVYSDDDSVRGGCHAERLLDGGRSLLSEAMKDGEGERSVSSERGRT